MHKDEIRRQELERDLLMWVNTNVVRAPANSSYKASVYRQMLKEVLIEWRAMAKRSGIDLESDPGPDGIKYRHFREALGWN